MRRCAWGAVCWGVLALAGCAPPAAPYEPGEALPGGETTIDFVLGSNAFAFPAANMSSERKAAFFSGNSFFNQAWVSAPASTTARDGLGPTFNARSCSACHFKDGRGNPGDGPTAATGLLIRLSVPGEPHVELGIAPEPNYGDQFQTLANLGIPAEGTVGLRYEERTGAYADGEPYALQVPHYELSELAFGPLAEGTMISPRIAPVMVGLGLLEAIPEDRLLELADPDDADGDGISGRINRVWSVERQGMMAGRFGWKAEQPTVRQQTAAAAIGDMGLTSELFPDQNCPSVQLDCGAAHDGGVFEIDPRVLDNMTFYARTLALPARREADAPEVLRGKALFAAARCDACHTPSHTTGVLEGVPEVSNQRIWPYTDLLLHDMGPELADGRPSFEASGSEWRTPPLWGLGLVPLVNGHQRLLHDGRARGFAEAILWHGGEAQASRDHFVNMTREERAALIRFLESL